jgi:membrane protein YqaA with SNARE-associated domain
MPRAGMGLGALALLFAWGFAEATVFFIVADVAVSWIALGRGLKPALVGALAAAAGAVLGIVLLHGWAVRDPAAALALVDGVPFVTAELIDEMRADLAARGPAAVLKAGATGVPIKIAAALAPGLGMGAAPFLIAGAAQRIGRFAAVALLAALIARLLRRRLSERSLTALWAGFWVLFYALYWTVLV